MVLTVNSTNNISFTANKIFMNKNAVIDSCTSFDDCSGTSIGKNKIRPADTLNRPQ